MLNPQMVVLVLRIEDEWIKNLQKHLSFYEGFIFFVTLLMLNFLIYHLGKQEGYRIAKKEFEKK